MEMTRYSNHYSNKSSRSDHYAISYPVDGEDEDEDFDDEEDDIDGLTDFDEDDELAERQSTSRDSGRYNDRTANHNGVFRRQRSFSDCTSHNLELDDNRRDHHNQLERKRRASIKTSYNDLREAIPSLRGSKASRAVILQRAVECIQELVRLNRDHTHCVETLRRQNDILDARVQELQRFAQRLDEEAANAPAYSVPLPSGPSTGGTLRLCPSSTHSGPGTSGLPVYRLLPTSESGERTTTIHVVSSAHSSNVATIRTMTSSLPRSTITTTTRARVAAVTVPTASHPAEFTGINALSAAACLLSTGNRSAFSSGSPSSASNCEPAQSSSQRSSPGCLSSSVSNASSSNQSGSSAGASTSRTDPCEEETLRLDASGASDSDCTAVVTSGSTTVAECSINQSVSPPPILLPVRSVVATSSAVPVVATRIVPSVNHNLIKRRRVT